MSPTSPILKEEEQVEVTDADDKTEPDKKDEEREVDRSLDEIIDAYSG